MSTSATLGFKLGGDPASVRELAMWLREHVAVQADAMSDAARWARDQLGPDLWWDPAAVKVYADFDAGARKAAEYADKLEYAIKVLSDVPDQAERGQLEHTDEYVKPPSVDDRPDSVGPSKASNRSRSRRVSRCKTTRPGCTEHGSRTTSDASKRPGS
jgi:hypothetical protein